MCTQPNGFNRQEPFGNVAGKKRVNPRLAFKKLQLMATGVPLAGPVDALDDDGASFMKVASGLLLHQGSPDSATECAEESVPGVFPPNPEQLASKPLINNTTRGPQGHLANREPYIYLPIHCDLYTKGDLRITGMKNCSSDVDQCPPIATDTRSSTDYCVEKALT